MCLVVTHTLNSGSNVFVPRCLNHREALSAGHDLTQLTAVLNDYPACSPTLQDSHVLSWQESVMTAGHGSTWKPVTACRNLNKGANLFWSIFVLSCMPFSPHGVSRVFSGVFFLAKVGQTGATPRTAGYSETNFAAAFHRCNLGIPQNFFLNFLA